MASRRQTALPGESQRRVTIACKQRRGYYQHLGQSRSCCCSKKEIRRILQAMADEAERDVGAEVDIDATTKEHLYDDEK